MELQPAGLNVLTGPSGAGKSTLALALCGFTKTEPNFEWLFKGKDLAQLPPPQRNISMMFQSLELFPHLSVRKNILFPATAQKMSQQKISQTLEILKEELKLSFFLDSSVQKISGGEKQRTALARALIVRADFLILDEPFSALDGDLKKKALKLIKQFLKERKSTALLIAHKDPEIMSKADKIFFIRKGQLDPDSDLRS